MSTAQIIDPKKNTKKWYQFDVHQYLNFDSYRLPNDLPNCYGLIVWLCSGITWLLKNDQNNRVAAVPGFLHCSPNGEKPGLQHVETIAPSLFVAHFEVSPGRGHAPVPAIAHHSTQLLPFLKDLKDIGIEIIQKH